MVHRVNAFIGSLADGIGVCADIESSFPWQHLNTLGETRFFHIVELTLTALRECCIHVQFPGKEADAHPPSLWGLRSALAKRRCLYKDHH